jgi:hypothetical protein
VRVRAREEGRAAACAGPGSAFHLRAWRRRRRAAEAEGGDRAWRRRRVARGWG